MDETEPATEDSVTIKNIPPTVKTDISKDDGTGPAVTGKNNANSSKNSLSNMQDIEEKNDGIVTKFLRTINWMPPWCRYDPNKPPKFTLSMNILLAFVCSTFTAPQVMIQIN